MGKIRGNHVSPGMYSEINDLSVATKTMGVTKLGLVGETVYGPAFEVMPISQWEKYTSYFGGTSAEKFKVSKYPKYELPYIAQSYLKASDQLYVCRVLGLSGYDAGPAFVITAKKDNGSDKEYVIAVLRSRASHRKYGITKEEYCAGNESEYDKTVFACKEIRLDGYTSPAMSTICGGEEPGTTESSINVTANSLARFTIVATNENDEEVRYAVSLNPAAKDYIYNVLGSNPYMDGDSAVVYVEELYDLYLRELAVNGDVSIINKTVTTVKPLYVDAVVEPVDDFVNTSYMQLTKKDVGKRFLAASNGTENTGKETDGYQYWNESVGGVATSSLACMTVGDIYEVAPVVDASGSTHYYYKAVKDASGNTVSVGRIEETGNYQTVKAAKVKPYDTFFYKETVNEENTVVPVHDMSNYLEPFRCASTPWIVSDLKGDGKDMEVKKLFRFHTISDGNSANAMIKVSIANIRPDEGLFDVLIRDYADTDASPIILESFRRVTMDPDATNYIGLKIGTTNGAYEPVSKLVTVEIIENDMTRNCVPAGFLGYPTRDFVKNTGNNKFVAPTFTYNTELDTDIKVKKQYFGLSNITGVDVDMLYYKGKNAYTEEYWGAGYTESFHLDSTLSNSEAENITIDGDEETKGVKWATPSAAITDPSYTHAPIIGTEYEMEGCMYEDVNTRKFTVYPCGGFDGWDVYRGYRSTGDEFRYNKYKGHISNKNGAVFSYLDNPEALGLSSKSISSDYYAYLAGIKQFANPEQFPINLFYVAGIDYVNTPALVDEVIDLVEGRGDMFTVLTTPDHPFGASDVNNDEMFTAEEAVDNLNDTTINTFYASTYYPWVKYYDAANAKYINLPPTKDALRNMADVDNKSFPWYAPSGIERGNVDAVKLRYFPKLEDEDELYGNRINPLKTFSQEGIKIWGNKTLYDGLDVSPLNRVNNVRLLIYMRSLIKAAVNSLVFEPNDPTLKLQFDNTIIPILADIKKNRGITEYKYRSSQTPEQMDAHEMSAVIKVKPTPTAEYFEIAFDVANQTVVFED